MPSSLTDPKPIENQQTSEVDKLEEDTELKEKAKQELLSLLGEYERKYYKGSYIMDEIKNLQDTFSIPPEVYTQPELQDAARRVIRHILIDILKEKDSPQSLSFVLFFNKRV